jgi:tRNA(Ile)-lysidine synthase
VLPRATIGGLLVLRPLLAVRRQALRRLLAAEGQVWREDESNRSPSYQRNRLRMTLAGRPRLTEALLGLGRATAALKDWVRRHSPQPRRPLPVAVIRDLPAALATEAARRWLVARGAPPGKLDRPALDRLVEMATDAASPARRHFPGGVLVRRRAGVLFVDAGADDPRKR